MGLFVIIIVTVLFRINLEVPQFIRILGCRYDAQPVSQVVFFEIPLRKVLQVPLRERNVTADGHFVLMSFYRHILSKIIRLAVHLDMGL